MMWSIFGNDKKSSKNLQIRELLKINLNFDGFYWYPLHAAPKADVTEYFETDRFVNDFGISQLQELLKELGYNQLWELTELDEDKLVSVDELNEYEGTEVIYCGVDAEWAIYFSHENTVTFAGEKIVSAVKGAWPGWDTYKDPWYS